MYSYSYYIHDLSSKIFLLGGSGDAPMGISVALSPATNTTTVSKSMITNASFRTKKLPGLSAVNLIHCITDFQHVHIFL